MIPATAFPHKYYLNLDRRADRRERCEALFADLGWDVRRHSAVDARTLDDARGFAGTGRYAHAVSTRLILRRATLAGAEAVLILEDDVVFHPALEERLAEMELPADWGIFYLGCQHCERPELVSPGLVRVRAPLDTHAWAVRREYFLEVRRALRGKFWPPDDTIPNADILLAELTRRVPSYAAYPNLAWQEEDESDLAGAHYANYGPDGVQVPNRHCLPGLLAEALGGRAHPPSAAAAQQCPAWFWPPVLQVPPPVAPLADTPPPRLRDGERVAFLFLTRGEHAHAEVWAEYWRGHEDRVSLYGHAKDRSWAGPPAPGDWLRNAQIPVHLPTEWGALSLVRAQMALLKAALTDARNRFFIYLSETCVPVRPLRDLLRMLSLDGRSRMQMIPHDLMEQLAPHKAARAPLEGRIPPSAWQFHSQWLLLNREAAELLAANECLLDCFTGTHAPDEAAFGTILHAAGWPFIEKAVSQSITWTHWSTDEASHPDCFTVANPMLMGEIAGSGCFFARKFAPGSGVERYGLHL
jgi:glycosyl transferase family 25